MREIPRMKESDPGAVPGASTELTAGTDSGKGKDTEQCSVEIAKVVQDGAAGAPGSTGAGAVAEGGPEVTAGPPEAPRDVARFCVQCLKYGDETALDYRAPEGALCAFHEADRRRKRVLEALGAQAAFETEVARVDRAERSLSISIPREDAWVFLALLLAALRTGDPK